MLSRHAILKPISIFIISLGAACSYQKQPLKNNELSRSQLLLHTLRDSLKIDYARAASDSDKSFVLDKYHGKLQHYLMKDQIDSIRVHVDEVVKTGLKIKTRFHDDDIEFQYSLTFLNNKMSKQMNETYDFTINLKPGSDTTISFSYTGACVVNKPDDHTSPIFKIFAFPIPLDIP